MSDDKNKAKGKGKKKATGNGRGGGRGKGGAKRRQGLGGDLREARLRFLEEVRERLDRGLRGEGGPAPDEERERLVRRVEARIARREEVKAQLTARIDEEIARDRELAERLKREGGELSRLIDETEKAKKERGGKGGKGKKPSGGKEAKGKKPGGGKGGKPRRPPKK